jgi:hypothetical protein
MAQAIYGLNMSIVEAYEIAPGQTEGNFSWKVASTTDAESDPASVLDQIVARPPRG